MLFKANVAVGVVTEVELVRVIRRGVSLSIMMSSMLFHSEWKDRLLKLVVT